MGGGDLLVEIGGGAEVMDVEQLRVGRCGQFCHTVGLLESSNLKVCP